MIPHHESVILIIKGFVQVENDTKLIATTGKMTADQNKEIEQFRTWSE
jgi:uncharacterized protein (DUF305 family)